MIFSKQKIFGYVNSLPTWFQVLIFVIAVRISLNIVAVLAVNLIPLVGILPSEQYNIDPRTFPGVWARWDAGYFMKIAHQGYSFRGDELAFYPAYPYMIRLMAFGTPSAMAWSGFVVSNVAFIVAILLFWKQVQLDHGSSVAWASVVSLSLFPTSLFFSAIYSEGLFLFFSILVYWFTSHKCYLLAGLSIAGASLTRVTGILLVVIPLIEIIVNRPARFVIRLLGFFLAASIGLGSWIIYIWGTQGSPSLIFSVYDSWHQVIVLPWESLWSSLGTFIGFHGDPNDWFLRVNSLQDLSIALLFVACAVLAFFWLRKSLFFYQVVVLLIILSAHGPATLGVWSFGRYAIVIFPGFIVIGILLTRFSRLRWFFWFASASLQLFFTAWFATGRWVG